MPVVPPSWKAATTPRTALLASKTLALTHFHHHHHCRPLQSSAHLHPRHAQNEAQDTSAPISAGDDFDIDPDSVQGRMIKALQQRYSPPRPSFIIPASPPPVPDAPTTPAQAQEALSQVIATSIVHAEQMGGAQAAVMADMPQASSSVAPVAANLASLPLAPSVPVDLSAPPGKFEEGRFLEKTPNNKPWLAQYVRPAHAGSRGGDGGSPAVYYGKLLQAGRTSSSSMKSTSQRLKDLGVNPGSLPLDDAKAMRAVREGIRRFEKAGRVYGAKYGALEYRTRKLTLREVEELQAEIEAESRKSRERRLEEEGEEVDAEGSGAFSTTMTRNLPDSVDSSRAPGGGGGGKGGGMSVRRWTSIADERIEAARAAGFFKENKLRGKPLQQDIDERNPYIGREEFLMNRMVKRQGASPPWVELNNTFYTHLEKFRNKILDSYSRRAVRSLTQSGALVSSGGPGTGTSGSDEERERFFVQLAQSYRDGGEWQLKEKGYHQEAIKQMNDDLKRHNFLCPPSARRGMLTREEELQRCYRESVPAIATGLRETWEEMTGGKSRNGIRGGVVGGGGQGSSSSSKPTFDIWGNTMDSNKYASMNTISTSTKPWTLTSLLFSSGTPVQDSTAGAAWPGDRHDRTVRLGERLSVGAGGRRTDEEDLETAKTKFPPLLGTDIVKLIKAWLLPAARTRQSDTSSKSESESQSEQGRSEARR